MHKFCSGPGLVLISIHSRLDPNFGGPGLGLTKALELYKGRFSPALRFEVLHSGVGLVGGQDGDLFAVGSFSSGDDLIL